MLQPLNQNVAHVDDPKGSGWSVLENLFSDYFLDYCLLWVLPLVDIITYNQRQNQRKRFY